jgi:hypothetical protein
MDKILKSIVKALLKACAPVVGSVTVDLAEAGVSHWLDVREKAAAEDIASRLFSSLRKSTQALTAAEGPTEHQITVALTNVEAIIGKSARFVGAWSAADFDPDRAAARAIDESQAVVTGLASDEVELVRSLLRALFAALASERKALEATEAAFRKSVLARIDGLATQIDRLTDEQRESVERAVSWSALSLHALVWQADLFPPGALLRADIDDPVPFHGRKVELEDALSWAADGRSLAVRLYTGAGGIGKTRLLREVAMRLRADGWRSGFLNVSATVEDRAFWQAVATGTDSRLYVIDYAENRRPQVVRLLRELIAAGNAGPRRVVLLARAGDDWWLQLKRQSDGVGEVLSGPATERHRLGPVAESPPDRRASYDIAVEHFARKLGRPKASAWQDELTDHAYERTLLLHMAALAAVEGVAVKGDEGILGYVLGRERRFWSDHLLARGLPQHLDRGIGRVMAAITLHGGASSPQQALEIVGAIKTFADQPNALRETVVQMLHELYPGDRWIEPLLPDLLGEQLIKEELEHDSEALLALVFDAGNGAEARTHGGSSAVA